MEMKTETKNRKFFIATYGEKTREKREYILKGIIDMTS